jgi:hypothetical protein
LVVSVPDQSQRGGVQSQIRLRLLKAFHEHHVPLPTVERIAVLPS